MGRNVKVIGDELAMDRLIQSVNYRAKHVGADGVDPPSPQQIAAVLHGLADHTMIMKMLEHRPDDTSPWPQATSVGRWFHDVGDDLEDREWMK